MFPYGLLEGIVDRRKGLSDALLVVTFLNGLLLVLLRKLPLLAFGYPRDKLIFARDKCRKRQKASRDQKDRQCSHQPAQAVRGLCFRFGSLRFCFSPQRFCFGSLCFCFGSLAC